MYKIEHYDNTVPYEIHKAAYDYCQEQRWYTGYMNMPPIDIDPKANEFKRDLNPYVAETTVYRIAFGADPMALQRHDPILNLFNHINDTLFDGRFEPAGRPEGSSGIALPKPDLNLGHGETNVNVPWYTGADNEQWKLDVINKGATSYMQAQPYGSIKRDKSIHRDWGGYQLEHNDGEHCTLLFVANLLWKPEWFSEIMYYDDDINGTQNLTSGIGWPALTMPNVPGRVILHDGRRLHTTRPTNIIAPELSQHIGFRVKLKSYP